MCVCGDTLEAMLSLMCLALITIHFSTQILTKPRKKNITRLLDNAKLETVIYEHEYVKQ